MLTTNREVRVTAAVENVAQAYLELLSLRGIEYFFANSGTDFASIEDGFARRLKEGKKSPRPLAIPHEAVLTSMAYGYYQATGRPQVAMVHVGVGTANGLGALIAAHRGRIPILFSAGRTPITEEGSPASRNRYIHWGQEYFDQAGMLREFVKWDYELRLPNQLETVVDRALTLAMAEPKGPVYLVLPREVLLSPLDRVEFQARPRFDLPILYPDPARIQETAGLLVRARSPLIITSSLGRTRAAVDALVKLAETAGIAVVSFNPEYMNFPTNHPCHQGFAPERLLPEADLVLVVDCAVPWYPNMVKPRSSATVIQVGIDPFCQNYPIHSFPADITLQGDPAVVLTELAHAAARHPERDEEVIRRRRKALQERHEELSSRWQEVGRKAGVRKPLDFDWVSYNVNRIVGEDTILVNEYDMRLTQLTQHRPGTYFAHPHAGYLGWGVGAALGIKLGSPDQTVIATVGDGAYMFAVPSACHFTSAAYGLPILTVVYNNQCWAGARAGTCNVHPQGWAVSGNHFPLSELGVDARYEKICEAFGGYGERVEDPEQLGPALERALDAVRNEKRQALLNVVCQHP